MTEFSAKIFGTPTAQAILSLSFARIGKTRIRTMGAISLVCNAARVAPAVPLSPPTRMSTRAAPRDVSWDPEGLFKNQTTKMSFFKEEEGESSESTVPPLQDAFLSKHPIRATPKGGLSDLKKFSKMLKEKYMPVDVTDSRVRILHLDPPILLVDEFFARDECEDIIEKLEATGRMAASTIGAGNLYGDNASSNRRTSSSVLIDDEIMNEYPDIKAFAESLQAKAFALLTKGAARDPEPWGRPGRAMLHRQWAFEGMQAAVYKKGQHFLEHEDAFPAALADENRFQRHATVLLYLNDVENGGETTFTHLDVSVKPRAGSVLIFFPAFSNSEADHRTLHIAREAVRIV